jgi:predicted dehydrogenase
MLRVAVIGFGKLGLLHAALVNALPGSRLEAVVDSDSRTLSVLKSRMHGVRFYKDHRKLLKDGDIDAAVIATPTGLHIDVAMDCVDAGLPIFIEKPLASTAAQARPLVEALKRQPVANMCGYMGRYTATFAKAKEIVSSGALGRPQMLRSSMYVAQLFARGKGWRYDKAASGGGVLITQNSHLIDKLVWLFGEVDYVSAQTRSLYSAEVEDHAHVFLSFKSGLAGYLDGSWSARHYRTPTISIHVQGEQATLDVDDDSLSLFVYKKLDGFAEGKTIWRKPDLFEGVSFDIGGPQYSHQMEAFIRVARDGGSVESDVRSAYEVQLVLEAMYRSAAAKGEAVRPAELAA